MPFPFRRRFYGKGKGRGKGGGGASSASDTTKPKTKTTTNKKKYSRFIITINPNIKGGDYPHGGEEGLRQRLLLCQRLLEKDRVEPYVYLMDKAHSFSSHIDTIVTDGAIEKGEKNRMLHIHILWSAEHRTRLRLQFGPLRSAFEKILDTGGKIHFNARLLRLSAETLQDVKSYIHKDDTEKSNTE
jgi:hypothetical protein